MPGSQSLSDSSDFPRIRILELKGLRNLVQFTIAQMGKLRPKGQASRHHHPACGLASTALPMCWPDNNPQPQFLAPPSSRPDTGSG